ncbi:MAG: adenylate/guanylate cyclase domain-containing protein [Gemmatimonadaceae bacterium]
MAYKLIGTESELSFALPAEGPLVVGRALGSDIPILDPTVSRRHAGLTVSEEGVRVQDLGSSNGTFVNGERVDGAVLRAGDVVVFGKMSFRVEAVPGEPPPTLSSETETAVLTGPAIVRQRPVTEPRYQLTYDSPPTGAERVQGDLAHAGQSDLNTRKLVLLLEVSKGLARAVHVDAMLETIASYTFQVMDVDRVAIALLDDSGRLVPKVSRDRSGTDAGRSLPQSIARKVVDDRVAVLTDNAPEDRRFGGQSILAQRVRSAMCAPLVGSEGRVLGVLYVDNLTTTQRFADEDLDFLIAFAGIAAVAIENSVFAERIRRESLVRGNFERYFTPSLAARIAESPEAVRLGGEKRSVVVLFSDIRGFTALSASMAPDDTAMLLSEFLSAMVDCVFRHGGVLDKFMGDSVMAQWGAPIGEADDADRALRAAVDMMAAVESLNEKLEIGIGVDCGSVFAGNIGSERRLEFTVIGDAVNTAAGLCAAAAGGEILVTDGVRRALRITLPLQACPPLALKGATQVAAYRVVA